MGEKGGGGDSRNIKCVSRSTNGLHVVTNKYKVFFNIYINYKFMKCTTNERERRKKVF
jgi:hypothetical protein